MSLFQNSGASFASAAVTTLHPPRPTLKRSQTPYGPSADSKRRRTSPTGAFSRLSLSPTSTRPAGTRQIIDEPYLPLTITNHKSNHEPNNRITNDNLPIHNNFQFGLFENQNQLPSHPSPSSHEELLNSKETKMRSTYSAYEIDSNRIFIESLSDGEASPTATTIQLEDEESDQKLRLEIRPEVAQQFELKYQPNYQTKKNIFLNSYKFISSNPNNNTLSENDQQLVLYQKPLWPVLTSPIESFEHLVDHDNEPQIVEIDNLNHLDQVQPCLSSHSIDSMELD